MQRRSIRRRLGGMETHMLLVASSDSEGAEKTLTGLAEAALSRGHEVTLFFSDSSVRTLAQGDGEGGYAGLHSRGVRLLACRTSALASDVLSSGGFMAGVEMSSLGELALLLEEHDRVVFIGGDGG
ncbi:hypothetical protein E2P65_05680 [Candidatus Bathyarchaeota archaeon]|nr:hypothetical protein E2P65_05680 [Candidatus Bathyarchaeota archaeon]